MSIYRTQAFRSHWWFSLLLLLGFEGALLGFGVRDPRVFSLGLPIFLTCLSLGARLLRPLLEISELGRGPGSAPGAVESSDELLLESEWGEIESRINRLELRNSARKAQLLLERERFRNVLDSLSEAVVVVNPEGSITLWNSRFADWFGLGRLATSGRKAPGVAVGIREIFRDRVVLDSFERTPLPSGEGSGEREFQFEGAGRPRSFSVRILRLSSAEQRMGVFRETTRIREAERMKTDLVVNVSHELRTPLTALRGFAETLSEDLREGRTESLQTCVTAILRNVDRLSALTQDLLDLSRLESSGDQALQRQELEVSALTQRVIAAFPQFQLEAKPRVLIEPPGLRVFADPLRVEQVLVNLVANALQHAGSMGPVEIAWSHDRTAVILEVRDSGPGISEEHLSRVFERFYRVDSDRSRATGGSGLGLAIVKHIVQAHGGEVSVKSRVGEGSQFICRFPFPQS